MAVAGPLSGGSWFQVLAVRFLNFVRLADGTSAAVPPPPAYEPAIRRPRSANVPGRAEEQVAHVLLGVHLTVLLLERLERGERARAADGPEVAVSLVGRVELRHVRRVVGRVQRREHALGDLATQCAELRDEPCGRRPAERIVVHDHVGLAPAEHVVCDPTRSGIPLRAVAVPAEEVRCTHDHRRVERAGRAVDERLRRMRLGVLRHGDRLVARERPDQDVGAELLHQALGLLDGEVGGVIRTTDADELDRDGRRSCRPSYP